MEVHKVALLKWLQIRIFFLMFSMNNIVVKKKLKYMKKGGCVELINKLLRGLDIVRQRGIK